MKARAARPAAKSSFTPAPGPRLQRKCACGTPDAAGKCPSCAKKQGEEDRKKMQRSAAGPAPAAAPPVVGEVLAGSGAPLDSGARGFFESRFGHDFSAVRVHTGPRAADSARAVNAHAYTVGEHIVFGDGQYAPGTWRGMQLLAHELTHTIQQGGLQRSAAGDLRLDGAPEDARLEAEAEAAARAIAAGAGFPAVGRAATTAVARTGRNWTPIPAGSPLLAWATHMETFVPTPGAPVAFRMRDPFTVPALKGPVLSFYQAKAQAGALEATIGFGGNSPNAALWQSRATTADLRNLWLLKVGWNRTEAAQKWFDHGGTMPPAGGFPDRNPAAGGSTCDMDHIVELQLGGTNERENVAPLNSTDNQQSGRNIWAYVSGLAADLRGAMAAPQPADITLHWDQAVQPGAPAAPTSCPAPGAAPNCSAVDYCAVTRRGAAATAQGAAIAGLENYVLRVGGADTVLRVNPGPGTTDLLNSGPENLSSAEAVPGLILTSLTRVAGRAPDRMEGQLESTTSIKRTRPTRVPMVLAGNTGRIDFRVDKTGPAAAEVRTLRLVTAGRPLQFTYPYLSPGELRQLRLTPDHGIQAQGVLRPSIPLLSQINIRLEDGNLSGSISVDPRRFRSPIPGFRLTRAEVTGSLTPQLSAAGEVDFEIGRQASGRMRVSADERQGFVATGDLTARIPGVDNATGNITYRDGQWSGGVHIESSRIPIPGIQSGSVDVGFTSTGLSVTGQVVAQLPGGQTVTLGVRRGRTGGLVFFGSATFELPRLRPVQVNVEYDGQHFSGSGRTGLTVGGFTGDVTVNYRDGRFSGTAALGFHRGRANGTATINVSPTGRISGSGTISYPITQNMVGTVGIALSEDGRVRVSGELVFSRPIRLFDGFQRNITVFEMPQVQIPIIAIPIGTRSIGLVGTIDARLGANFGVGPGELLNTRAAAAFNPLEDNPNPEIELSTTVNIPARAGLSFTVRGGIGLSAGIASVTGGLSVTASATLEGGFRMPTSLTYRAGVIVAQATPTISAALILGLRLDADVTAAIGAFGLGVSKTWTWPLAGYRFDPGLSFSVSAPIRWASNEPFRAPSLSDIQFQRPNFDLSAMLPRIFNSARRTETES